jgi:hypothetical protein
MGSGLLKARYRKIQLMKSDAEGNSNENSMRSSPKTGNSIMSKHCGNRCSSNDWRSRGASVRRRRNVGKGSASQRAEAWRLRKQQEIPYLGDGVSGGLNYTDCDEERLQAYGLPVCQTPEQIASAMGISVGQLRFLAFSRDTSTISHYIRFKIPKKTGGERLISAPMPRLKNAQHWILVNILEKLELHDAAHGFRRDRSIVSNAQPHVGADVIINFDLKDFFPSISYKRVKGLFQSFGYSEAAATIFGLLCTQAQVEEVELDGKTYYVATTDRHLPQGSPASPAITNLLCRRLDRRLMGIAENLGFVYTRYADDLTFSASGESLCNICNILRRTESIVAHEGFAINEQKTRILRGKSVS